VVVAAAERAIESTASLIIPMDCAFASSLVAHQTGGNRAKKIRFNVTEDDSDFGAVGERSSGLIADLLLFLKGDGDVSFSSGRWLAAV
jgi:hypothetical protein